LSDLLPDRSRTLDVIGVRLRAGILLLPVEPLPAPVASFGERPVLKVVVPLRNALPLRGHQPVCRSCRSGIPGALFTETEPELWREVAGPGEPLHQRHRAVSITRAKALAADGIDDHIVCPKFID